MPAPHSIHLCYQTTTKTLMPSHRATFYDFFLLKREENQPPVSQQKSIIKNKADPGLPILSDTK